MILPTHIYEWAGPTQNGQTLQEKQCFALYGHLGAPGWLLRPTASVSMTTARVRDALHADETTILRSRCASPTARARGCAPTARASTSSAGVAPRGAWRAA
eukprot:395431-Prymnesium_polylepis.1